MSVTDDRWHVRGKGIGAGRGELLLQDCRWRDRRVAVDASPAIEDKLFREELYFRINVISVKLPPLRARGGDILLLAQHFLEQYATKSERLVTGILPPAAERLMAYPWPGNVRELAAKFAPSALR